ncbi:Uncharacterised protein [Salmonella bongori]|nr:Uncharacterised protein [Salmonella bongori]
MGINVSVSQFLVKASELVDIVIDALFFNIGATALNALDDLLFGKPFERLPYRYAAYAKRLLKTGFRR